MAVSSKHSGWKKDPTNSRLDFYFDGTRMGHLDASGLSSVVGTAATGPITATTIVTGTTGLVATTGDIKGTAGNLRLGVISAFATTEPTSAVVMKTGTAPAGAITTSGGIFSSATVVQKIIAAGTVSNVET